VGPFHQLHTTAEDGLPHSYLELAHHAHNRTYSVFQHLMNHLYVQYRVACGCPYWPKC
jgi:hypothetical protein